MAQRSKDFKVHKHWGFGSSCFEAITDPTAFAFSLLALQFNMMR
jgi:hypothetical protein